MGWIGAACDIQPMRLRQNPRGRAIVQRESRMFGPGGHPGGEGSRSGDSRRQPAGRDNRMKRERLPQAAQRVKRSGINRERASQYSGAQRRSGGLLIARLGISVAERACDAGAGLRGGERLMFQVRAEEIQRYGGRSFRWVSGVLTCRGAGGIGRIGRIGGISIRLRGSAGLERRWDFLGRGW